MFKNFVKRFSRRVRQNSNAFLNDSSGIIHIGANEGQERDLYASFELPVVWVEPIPDVFNILAKNIAPYPNQRAFRYLVTEEDQKEYAFHIASNGGASSSILDFARHAEIWPEVSFTRTLNLFSVTLPTLLKQENIDISKHNALVLDTQGSELMILRGAGEILSQFQYVKLEVSDFEAYKGCCRTEEVARFMSSLGFLEANRKQFAEDPSGGAYYNIVYRNKR